MIYGNIKAEIEQAFSDYTAERCVLMRRGKYTGGDHLKDGYVAMAYETLMELSPLDDMYPFGTYSTRVLIGAFNRLTSKSVMDVWTD